MSGHSIGNPQTIEKLKLKLSVWQGNMYSKAGFVLIFVLGLVSSSWVSVNPLRTAHNVSKPTFSQGFLEHDSWITVELQHSLAANSESFSFRGNVTIPSLNSGLANVEQPDLSTADLDLLKVTVVRAHGHAGRKMFTIFHHPRVVYLVHLMEWLQANEVARYSLSIEYTAALTIVFYKCRNAFNYIACLFPFSF